MSPGAPVAAPIRAFHRPHESLYADSDPDPARSSDAHADPDADVGPHAEVGPDTDTCAQANTNTDAALHPDPTTGDDPYAERVPNRWPIADARDGWRDRLRQNFSATH